MSSDAGDWAFGINATHLLESSREFTRGLPPVEQLNTVWGPVDTRVRANVGFSRQALSASAFLNYTDSYRDVRTPNAAGPGYRAHVASWSTVDLNVRYELDRFLKVAGMNASISFSALNVLDRDPPFVASLYGLHFDGVNANPLGRFLSAQLVVDW